MTDNELTCTPPEMRELAAQVTEELLPEKSKGLYLKTYDNFKNWCNNKNVPVITENVLLAYFQEYSKDKKASTLWSHYSMLRATLLLRENIDISKFFKLVSYLKRQNANYKPKKSSVFSQEDIINFLTQAPDECYIAIRAVLAIGVAGACRGDELCNLLLSDVITKDDIIVINIRTSKNGSSRKFVIMDPLWIQKIKKYLTIRSNVNLPRLFVCIRNGKAVRQNIGHNTIAQMPSKIADYLKLANPTSYTGHSFRRSSATILAAGGGNTLQLKQHGGWKSAAVAEGYVEDSLAVKKTIARMVQRTSTSTSSSLATSSVEILPSTSTSTPVVPASGPATVNNTVVNIPTCNLTNASENRSGQAIHMTCHNCTVNYNFYK